MNAEKDHFAELERAIQRVREEAERAQLAFFFAGFGVGFLVGWLLMTIGPKP